MLAYLRMDMYFSNLKSHQLGGFLMSSFKDPLENGLYFAPKGLKPPNRYEYILGHSWLPDFPWTA